MINSRKLGSKEFNVFRGFFSNWYFIAIFVLTIGIQIAIVEYGGRALRAAPLSLEQNLICLAIGVFELIWGAIIKVIIPPSIFDRFSMNEKPMDEEEASKAMTSTLRKSMRQSIMKRVVEAEKSKVR